MIKKLTGIIMIVFLVAGGGYISANDETSLSDSVLRLHVIANSDTLEDQQLKLAVKDEVVAYMAKELKDMESLPEVIAIAEEKAPAIEQVAQKAIQKRGYGYPVNVYVSKFDFPAKSYGNMVFPQGEYNAVRIVIGEGRGKNWWCVLFPPLCLVSSSDKGLNMDSPEEAQISFKCLELLPKGVKISEGK